MCAGCKPVSTRTFSSLSVLMRYTGTGISISTPSSIPGVKTAPLSIRSVPAGITYSRIRPTGRPSSEDLEVLGHLPRVPVVGLRVDFDFGALHHHQVVDERVTERCSVDAARREGLDRLAERLRQQRSLGGVGVARDDRRRLGAANNPVEAGGDVRGEPEVRVRGRFAKAVLDVRAGITRPALDADQRAAVVGRPGDAVGRKRVGTK